MGVGYSMFGMVGSDSQRRPRTATRSSFVERLRDWGDNATWSEFMSRYGRTVRRVAVQAGLRPEEADDVVQETVATVARKMPSFDYDRSRCTLEHWVRHVTSLRIKDQLRRRMPRVVSGGATDGTAVLERMPDLREAHERDEAWEEAWKRELLDRALDKVQLKVSPAHYQLFCLSVVDGRPGAEVARTLGVSLPKVYVVRHRVLRVLRAELQRIQRTPGGLG